jgi:hypothetical protein
VYNNCIFCKRRFGSNEVLQGFPVGHRIAFDPAKGRLWVVCRTCERWSLVPIEERWEIVEECEELFRNTRSRFSTENIGLARLSAGYEIVRIGKPQRREFAFWRYGDQFGRRRRRVVAASLAMGGAATIGIAYGLAIGLPILTGTGAFIKFAPQARRLASILNGQRLVARVGTIAILRGHLAHLELEKPSWMSNADGDWVLRMNHGINRYTLWGTDASTGLFKVLPAINMAGAGQSRVAEAIEYLETVPSPSSLPNRILRHTSSVNLHGLAHAHRLALEMAVSEQTEAAAFEQELSVLEVAWREADEIAAIADDLVLDPRIAEQAKKLKQAAADGHTPQGVDDLI